MWLKFRDDCGHDEESKSALLCWSPTFKSLQTDESYEMTEQHFQLMFSKLTLSRTAGKFELALQSRSMISDMMEAYFFRGWKSIFVQRAPLKEKLLYSKRRSHFSFRNRPIRQPVKLYWVSSDRPLYCSPCTLPCQCNGLINGMI